jgi:phenylacetate-CoA ligase
MFATAELFPPAMRQTFVKEYGLAVANCYATAELGFLALDTTGQMAMGLLPEPIIQVVDPDTGQTVGPGEVGEVVVTNFSRVYPLVRFGTGDMAVNIDPRPGDSIQKERGIILVGRRGEAVKVRGMFVHPNQLSFALGQVSLTGAVQGTVSRRENKDYFTVRVAPAEPPGDPAALVNQIKEHVRAVCRVRVDEVDLVDAADIPADAPGIVDERSWS